MKRSIMQQRPDNLVVPLGITKGGTGAKTAEQARTNLDLTPVTLIGQANGIAPLSDEYKIESQYLPPADVNVISIIGWLSGSALQPMKFIITDYDFFTQYTITAQYGTVSRNEDIITYTPALGHEVQGFVANGVTYDVNVAPSYIQVPVITLPVTGSTISTNPRFIISSAFNTSGISDTHLSSTWQLSDDALFTNIIAESIDDAVNLTSWLTPQLNISTAYYVRVKYTGHILNTSDWSVVNSFTTININYPVNEVAILSKPLDIAYGTGTGSSGYGSNIALSNDGTILVISDRQGGLNSDSLINTGIVYIYKKINSQWVLQHAFSGVNDGVNSNAYFGWSVAITQDKQTIIIAATKENQISPPIQAVGRIYIYRTTITDDYTSLVLVTSMSTNSGEIYSYYGYSLSITPNAEKIVVSTFHDLINANGSIYIYNFNGSTLTEEAVIPGSSSFSERQISNDGLTLVCYQKNSESGFIYSGRLEIYNFNGLNWNLTASFTDDVVRTNAWFGYPSTISNDGTMVVTTTEGIDDMSLFIYELIGGTWIRTHKIPFPPEFFMYGGEIDYILINQTKDLIALGAPYVSNSQSYPINGDWDSVGAVYIYIKINNNWVLDHTLLPNTIDINQNFGESIVMDASGSTLVVTATGAPVNSNPLYHGAVYIYE